jgi:hypothetical protein
MRFSDSTKRDDYVKNYITAPLTDLFGCFAIMDIVEVLKEHTKMPFERLRVARHLDELRISAIRRGIIFIFAV